MTPSKRTLYLVLTLSVLAAVSLACGTGYQTSSKLTGNSGEVRLKMKDPSGTNSTSVEISEDWPGELLAVNATLSVEAGSCRATLSGADGTQLVLDASAGSPTEEYGELITDVFGDFSLQTDCQGGQNLELLITFSY